MKKLLLVLTLSIVYSLTASAQQSPSADEVINKYIKVLGGKEALEKIKDISAQSTISNNSASNKQIWKYKIPDKRLVVINDGTGKIIYWQVIDGKQVTAKFGDSPMPTKPADLQLELLNGQWIPELNLKKNNVKYSLEGTEAIKGKQAYKIAYTLANGTALWTSYYDTQVGLLVRTVYAYQDGPLTMDISDYRAVNGIQLPYHSIDTNSTGQYVTQVSKYEFNTGLSDEEFVVK
ncbi:LolA family protein [Spirosoma panaciterrae]|uniref:LolA family protein n=1 Tax=Spirosoma panaciterrae TaxID=496058 RepID=UPI00037CA9A8|nr:hypothetical protein [Spirosoma panaciterrae]